MANLLTPTNSLTNNIYANARQNQPKVGDGATRLMYTDRHAGTIVEVVNAKTIRVQEDTSMRVLAVGEHSMSDCQQYTYSPNPNGQIQTVSLRSNGRWVVVGEAARNGTSYVIGVRDTYHDYSF